MGNCRLISKLLSCEYQLPRLRDEILRVKNDIRPILFQVLPTKRHAPVSSSVDEGGKTSKDSLCYVMGKSLETSNFLGNSNLDKSSKHPCLRNRHQIHSVGSTLRSYPRTTFGPLTTCEQQTNNQKPSRLITFPPTSWMLFPWQSSSPGKVTSDAAHPIISTPHRLRTSEIPMPKYVSSVVTHRCHHGPALSKIGTLSQNRY